MRRIRRSIVNGTYAPGSRIPPRLDLAEDFGASSATIQKAVDRLAQQGFLETRDRAGTFVCERLPHQMRVALVFPAQPGSAETTSRFWKTIRMAAEGLGAQERIEVRCFHGIDATARSAGFHELQDALESDQFAAVLGVSLGWSTFRGTALAERPRLVRVGLMGYGRGEVPGIELAPYAKKVCADAAARGQKRLAVLYSATRYALADQDEQALQWREAAFEFGLEIRPEWLVPAHPSVPQTAWSAARLLARQAPLAPDAFAIADDHLIESATNGLADLGLTRIPDVYGHANFPDRPPAALPVRRIGYDIVRLLEAGLSLVEVQLEGETAPAVTSFEAQFEDELPHQTGV